MTAAGARPEDDAGPMPIASALGLVACPHCSTVWREAPDGARCLRCGGVLHRRRPGSIGRTWALLLSAIILYLPANLLPVMQTRSLFGVQEDTILSGILYFWTSDEYALAAIIFIASFLVPLFKLVALTTLLVLTQLQSGWALVERTRLFRVVELIGRWSMLDVFVVAVLSGLVQIQGLAQIRPGFGISAFGLVVVLTMLASQSFDPRLAWDAAGQNGSPLVR